MPEPHRQCASVLITDHKGRVLFVRQSYGGQFYAFPGGVVDWGETPPAAGIRETLEEVNVVVELEYQLGAYLLTGGGWPDIFASVYKGKMLSGSPKPDLEEITEICWRSLSDLPSPLPADTKAALEDFEKGSRGVVRRCPRTMQMPAWKQ